MGNQELGCPTAVEGKTELKTVGLSPQIGSELSHPPCDLEHGDWTRSEGLAPLAQASIHLHSVALRHQLLALPSRAAVTAILEAII